MYKLNLLNVFRIALKKFLDLKIKNKFMLSYVFFILLIAPAISWITIHISTSIMKDNSKELSQQLMRQLSINIDNKIKEFEGFTFNVVNNTRFKEILRHSTLSEEDTSDTYINNKTISDIINQYITFNNVIQNVCVETQTNNVYWFEKYDFNKKDDFITKEKARKYIDNVRNKFSENNPILWLSDDKGKNVVFCRQIIDTKNLKRVGIIYFSIDSSYFEYGTDNNSLIHNENILILNTRDEILIPEKTLRRIDLTKKVLHRAKLGMSLSSFDLKFNKYEYIVTHVKTQKSGWKIFFYIKVKDLMRKNALLRIFILIICVFSILIASVIALIISTNISKNIHILEKSMQKVEGGDFTIKVNPVSYDEIGLLGIRFNFMVNKINELIDTVSKERIAKQQAEFQTMQAQINPHFLYNSLGSIRWLANRRKDYKTEKMIIALIELLKYAVKKKGEYQTVDEEIFYIKNYLALQKMRYGDQFNVIYKIDDNVRNCSIINFLLQPFVENALYHGLDMSNKEGIIWLEAYQLNDNIVLCVKDNGAGMDEEKIQVVLSKSNKKVYPGLNSIGIKNVMDRLKIYYGNEFSLNINSRLSEGTEIKIILPFKNHYGGCEENA